MFFPFPSSRFAPCRTPGSWIEVTAGFCRLSGWGGLLIFNLHIFFIFLFYDASLCMPHKLRYTNKPRKHECVRERKVTGPVCLSRKIIKSMWPIVFGCLRPLLCIENNKACIRPPKTRRCSPRYGNSWTQRLRDLSPVLGRPPS
ncbi:hypothetical protein LX32DRAFT_253179 [Colletotrichum zoysiae]|uniref:Uncharacterized protein n=1 Tax=Colletotrichum zoysiae TaxID=1216348 RepID=A0AAD9HW27_9PEZI|nr:hypothetical protein LX32DRAFT_253179 [Colletotrichum zoysiae]